MDIFYFADWYHHISMLVVEAGGRFSSPSAWNEHCKTVCTQDSIISLARKRRYQCLCRLSGLKRGGDLSPVVA
jgi:hypothetical protein